MNNSNKITFNPKVIFKHKNKFTNFKLIWQVILWTLIILPSIMLFILLPRTGTISTLILIISIILVPLLTWILNKIFYETIIVYNSQEITKIAYNKMPIICNLLFKIRINNHGIQSISQVSKIQEDDDYYMYIQSKSNVNETVSSYATVGTGYNKNYNLSTTTPNKSYEYSPERLNITVYKNNNEVYQNTLEHFQEIYHMHNSDPKIKDINKFIKISMNDALHHII